MISKPPRHTGREGTAHPVSANCSIGHKNLKDLAKDIARRSTVHEGTVVGLLCDLESIIANYLADGYNVKLGELGTFSATLTCRKVTDKSEIRAASVHFDNIKFKPTRKFRKEVRSKGKLERAEYGFGPPPPDIQQKNALYG